MSIVVSLREVVNGLEMCTDQVTSYLNVRTGDVVQFTSENVIAADVECDLFERRESQRQDAAEKRDVLPGEDFISLPSHDDIHENRIIESFCRSLHDKTVREALLDRIRSGEFRRFEEGIYRYKIANEWFRYRGKVFEKIAVEWLEKNEIPCTNDIPPDEA